MIQGKKEIAAEEKKLKSHKQISNIIKIEKDIRFRTILSIFMALMSGRKKS